MAERRPLRSLMCLMSVLFAFVVGVCADTHYVNVNNASPSAPYTNWATAAIDIQSAVDEAIGGDIVLVTNGTDFLVSEISITNATTVRSVNGAGLTIVDGLDFTRCFNVRHSGAVVEGLTITRGKGGVEGGGGALMMGGTIRNCIITESAAETGGGVDCSYGAVISNCTIRGNSASVWGGGISCAFTSVVCGCSISNNGAFGVGGALGGGVYCFFGGRVKDSTISSNCADISGGVECCLDAIVEDCTIIRNQATLESGGGVSCGLDGIVRNCAIWDNSADFDGGGAYCYEYGLIKSCFITSNLATYNGGGVQCDYRGVVENCVIVDNAAGFDGGGVWLYNGGMAYNCTVVSNSAGRYGGGVKIQAPHVESAARNNIIYYNSAGSSGTNWHTDGSALSYSYCCTVPDPGGSHNITAPPQFVAGGLGDFSLAAASPCIEAGINMDWMFDSADIDGGARIRNGTVDIGAHEVSFLLGLRLFLQGPYDTNTSAMTTALTTSGHMTLTSPYQADICAVSHMPSNVTDWVLVELRANSNSVPDFTASAFLRNDGMVISTDGGTGLVVDVSPGDSRYLAVKHRNHLTVMSAAPVIFTNLTVFLDFTAGSTQYFGGASGAVEIKPGIWGMIAGDADGDGKILTLDRSIYQTQTNFPGYYRGDFNLDGIVSNDDLSACWTANQSRQTAVPAGEVLLSPSLKIEPPVWTILSGTNIAFVVQGSTNQIHAEFVSNPSGGTLNPTTLLYQAGSVTGSSDIIQFWASDNPLGRARVNVVGDTHIAWAGRAIVIAGRRSVDDPVWPNTDYMAANAFNCLLYRNYSKATIQYLSPEPDRDVDGNGLFDDIDMIGTHANAAFSITNWAAGCDKLFIYMVDHGGDSSSHGYFRLNDTEVITAAELNTWLNALQNAYHTEVTLVIDCCYSGSFLDELSYGGAAKRIVVAACGPDDPTYFIAGGVVSFSDAFFAGVMMGLNVKECFEYARDAMAAYQDAMLDDDGNGVYQIGVDGSNAANVQIGGLEGSRTASKTVSVIGLVCGNQLLDGATTANLWADDIVSEYDIERVWCMIIPPGHNPNPSNPVSDIVELDLAYDPAVGRYQASYDGFTDLGTYKVEYYAKDIWGGISEPRQSYVSQVGFDERVIIVAGGPTNETRWEALNNLANLTYDTCRQRWFGAGSVCYLNPCTNQDLDQDGTNDVDALPTLANLRFAITNWAMSTNWGGPADKLTVYLVGEGTNGTFRLNESEYLPASGLDSWLDTYQASNHAPVCVVLEFDGAGGFLPNLAPQPGDERITVASTAAGGSACMGAGGIVSFTRSFMSHIFNGETIGDAFDEAKQYVGIVTGRSQKPQLDDNGDGIYESKIDGALAKQRHIGTAFMTGADVPAMGSVMPNTVLPAPGSVVLWVAGVTDVDGISNVWCVVTPPDYNGVVEPSQTNLAWNVANKRYEAVYTNFTQNGAYVCTFFAQDNRGGISAPKLRMVSVADAFEPDNTPAQARQFVIGGTQGHTFHVSNDVDWVKFYAVTNYSYQIDTTHVGTNVDTILTVYREEPDGTLTNVFGEDIDDWGGGIGMGETVILTHPQTGMYYIKVRAYGARQYGSGTEYDLTVWVPVAAAGVLVVLAVDKLDPGHSPPGAVAIVDGVRTQAFGGMTTMEFTGLAAGIHTVRVPMVSGYRGDEDPALPDQVANMNSYLYGNPKYASVANDAWQMAVFQFVPYGRVDGVVRDKWTGGRIQGAKVTFDARTGNIAGLVYDGYPNNASYESNWYSLADGSLPTNVWLPAVSWNMTVSRPGYTNGLVLAAVTNLNAGSVASLGQILLEPGDTNGNGIADSWEGMYFAGQAVAGTNDADHDGSDDWHEYICGTDPTNGQDVLCFDGIAEGHSITLTWRSVPGRSYQVMICTNLIADSWSQGSDPMDATNGQTEMQWTDTNTIDRAGNFYRVRVARP